MLYFLTGTTASGKSAIAHKIAIEKNIPILSLDSMAVYKGIDILTAKPTEVMRTEVLYYGLDIAETDQYFSFIPGSHLGIKLSKLNGLAKIYTFRKYKKKNNWEIYGLDKWEQEEVIKNKLDKISSIDPDVWIIELEDEGGNYPNF